MYGLDYTKVKAGDKVAVARMGSWHTHSEGVYTVVKADKMKIVIQRESDGYERTFSVKRKCELGKENSWRSAYLESVEDKEARDARLQKEREVRDAWKQAEQAAANKNLSALKQALADLEVLVQ